MVRLIEVIALGGWLQYRTRIHIYSRLCCLYILTTPANDNFHVCRFLEGTAEEAKYGPKNPNAYIPFGGGSRKCIGSKLADLNVRLLVQHILHNFTLKLVDGQVPLPLEHNLLLKPKNGLIMQVAKRAVN